MAVIRQFMAIRVSISSQLIDLSSASMQFLVTLMAKSKMEMTIGKLRTAIKILLLFALAAIPDSMVSEEAKPNEVSRIVIENKKRSTTGLFRKRTKSTKPVNESRVQRMKL